jgi:hypothetical protein
LFPASGRAHAGKASQANLELGRMKGEPMFLRIDKLQIELPATTKFDPNAAAAVQELLGGRFGEMSTLSNYLHQSVAFKQKKKLRPSMSWWPALPPRRSGTSSWSRRPSTASSISYHAYALSSAGIVS